ncbi:GAK system ATP-grasp enzyme [Enhygromyxa salina]|uniref:Alpha-aminoadipate--LysW ligase LysX n=1 Tax=Enhygromyxa salina TaxID=215803 RepID=A0A2S9YR99_9BACT|nr:GAK system ATP-grasp enzyme [Enhygromyxa salina]PRQ07589.1 Alpha-aminoadipate--LysW ligase LysX [Enhygromyxa salina]
MNRQPNSPIRDSDGARIAVVGIQGGWSTDQLLDAVEARTGYRRLIEMQDVALQLGDGASTARVDHHGFDLRELDGVIVKKIARQYSPDALDRVEILRVLERAGVRVFSRPAAMRSLIDRLACTVELQLGQIPMPPTTITESVDEAIAAITRYGAAVAKPLYTSKARGMLVLRAETDPASLRAQVESFSRDNPVMYLQQLIDMPGRDLGVVFLGGEYLATYARVSGGSWTTSTSKGGKYQPHQASDEIIALAHRAQALFELDFTCVDVVETPAGPQVFEVSAFGGFRGLLEACDIDAAGRYVDYALSCLERERPKPTSTSSSTTTPTRSAVKHV